MRCFVSSPEYFRVCNNQQDIRYRVDARRGYSTDRHENMCIMSHVIKKRPHSDSVANAR